MRINNEIRSKELKIRLRPDEMVLLQMRKTKPKLAEWAREVLLEQSIQQPAREFNPDLLFELNKIGVNLNQITRKINMDNAITDPNGLASVLLDVQKQFERLVEEC